MGMMRRERLDLIWRAGRMIPLLDAQVETQADLFCICIQCKSKYFYAFYQCCTWDHSICNSLCTPSASIGLNVREVSPQVWMNLWLFAKHAGILLLRIITELTSLERKLQETILFRRASVWELRTSWVSFLLPRFPLCSNNSQSKWI